jgi:signal transduction histidine kinase
MGDAATGMSLPPGNLDAATIEWIYRFAPYGVVATDRDLCVRNWNQWMKNHSGRDLEQVQGRKLTEIFPDLVGRRLEGPFQRALAGEVSVLSTALHGHLFPLQPVAREAGFQWMKQTARIGPLLSKNEIQGVIIVIEDVTQREWQAEVLRQQHARDEILSWALAHLLKSDDPRRVSRELFGKVAAHLDFDAYMLYLAEADGAAFRLSAAGGLDPDAEASTVLLQRSDIPWINSWTQGETLIREFPQIQTDPAFEIGKSLGFHAYIVLPLAAGADLLGFLTFATRSRDFIGRNEAELLGTISQYLAVSLNREKTDRELRSAQKKLNEHAQDLEKKVADRTASLKQIIAELQTFSYTVAHDLRAPIRALKGYSEVLLEDFAGEMPAEATAVVGRLRDASIRMDSLTRDLLEFSKISRQDIQLEPIQLDDIVAGVIVAVGKNAPKGSITVADPLPSVLGHRTLVHQCVANLIENALKFVQPGTAPKVSIRGELASAAMASDSTDTKLFNRSRYSLPEHGNALDPSQPRVRIWVEDQGIGIPAEVKDKVFGIFERGVDADQFEGTGIGLAIVARAMERMGGDCGVESEPGQGSRFWLEFRAPTKIESSQNQAKGACKNEIPRGR